MIKPSVTIETYRQPIMLTTMAIGLEKTAMKKNPEYRSIHAQKVARLHWLEHAVIIFDENAAKMAEGFEQTELLHRIPATVLDDKAYLREIDRLVTKFREKADFGVHYVPA